MSVLGFHMQKKWICLHIESHLWFTSNPLSDRRWILDLCALVPTDWAGFGFRSGQEAFWENEV